MSRTTYETTLCATRDSKRLKIHKRLYTPGAYVYRLTRAHSAGKQGVCSMSDNGVSQVLRTTCTDTEPGDVPTACRGVPTPTMWRGPVAHLLCEMFSASQYPRGEEGGLGVRGAEKGKLLRQEEGVKSILLSQEHTLCFSYRHSGAFHSWKEWNTNHFVNHNLSFWIVLEIFKNYHFPW